MLNKELLLSAGEKVGLTVVVPKVSSTLGIKFAAGNDVWNPSVVISITEPGEYFFETLGYQHAWMEETKRDYYKVLEYKNMKIDNLNGIYDVIDTSKNSYLKLGLW